MITDKQRQRDYEYEADYQSKSRYTTEQWTNILNSGQLDEKNISLLKKIYSSFNHYSIAKILELDPKASTGILYADIIYDVVNYAKKIGTGYEEFYRRELEDRQKRLANLMA